MNARDRFRPGKNFKLREEDADDKPLRNGKNGDLNKEQVKDNEREQTAKLGAQITVLQEMMYAQRKYRVLVILQGMDTSGKDSTISALFSSIDPMGMRAIGFRQPTGIELAHDFLWRIHPHVPLPGEIAIFNRSHYEDVLVALVEGRIDDKECKRRYQHIIDFERMLAETGTTIVKLFLHISKDEQRERLQARLDDPQKQWKFDSHDLIQRKRWNDYQQAYQRAIAATDTDQAPWYVIPSNSKVHRNLLVSTLLLEIMQDMKLSYPKPDPELAKLKVE